MRRWKDLKQIRGRNNMNVLDLFSGIGGFSHGLERAGMETVAFCEIDKFCQKVLKKHWPNVPIFNDVRNLDYDGAVDLICGGFPCQPFSVAGKQKGKDDDRHLWPAMFSLIQKYRPSWVIGENVAGIINMGLDDVLTDLGSEGYTTRTFVIPACAVNAPHRRDRVWIVGYSEYNGQLAAKEQGVTGQANAGSQEGQNKHSESARPIGAWETLSDPDNERRKRCSKESLQGKWERISQPLRACEGISGGWDLPTPRVCRGDDGIPNRTHRLRSLGNSVVPQIPEIIGRAIMQFNQ